MKLGARFVLAVTMVCAAMAQDFTKVTVERIVTGQKFVEGPAWCVDGYLLFSDNLTDKLQKFTPGRGLSEIGARPAGASGNAYDDQGRLYTAEFRERRVTRTDKNGKSTVLAAKFEGKRLNAPKDVVVRRDGIVYFTDPAFGNQQDSRELDFYGVYRISTRGEIEAIAHWKDRPSGIALSPNGRVLYVSAPDAREIRAFDLGRNGEATNERVVVEKTKGVPGGIKVDEKGNLWVAASGVSLYAPGGMFIHEMTFAEQPSNLAFGDPDFGTLYITARTTVYRVRLNGVKGSVQYAPQVP